ncbi:hypothetical protein [Nannocystis pusilla]|uniref:Restriction endonuclease subunit S n=1 Tax=Nannocystis pusilla TaxID=889268 RepID=A0ABS7U088_9BACT|nr:hypothetical protein [Nannocystis pusilla]MBZ5713937.1 hypothetical protein [Nannocystis pusilla]
MRAFVVEEPRSRALRALNYSPAVERIRRAGSSSARPLRQIVKSFGPAYGTVFTRLDCHSDHGIELLSQSDMFAAEPRGRVIRSDSLHEPDEHLVKRGQVLIAGAGTLGENELYGRAILADDRLAGKYVGPDSMTLVFEDPDDDFSLFAYAWLASPTGVQAIRSTSYGTKILRFRSELLQSLPVPVAPLSTIKRVAGLIRRCSSLRETFFQRLLLARAKIERLPDMQEATLMCGERSRRTIEWRGPFPSLCAWTFASTGGALRFLADRWEGRLRDFAEPNGIFNGQRFARIDCAAPHGVELMSQRDALLIRPVPRRIVTPDVPAEKLFVRPGTILVGAQGTLGEGEIFGRALFVTEKLLGVAFTQHLLRIIPREPFAEALYAFLTTTVGFRLLRSTAVGTKLLSMRTDLLANLPLPELNGALGRSVSELVQSAFASRDEADDAEAEAIRIIEEEVLPQWLA